MDKIRTVVITGPTATGKTSLGVRLADRFDGEIISVDSRQVYQGLDIGSGKDLEEYTIDGVDVPYHLIDIVPASADYNLMCFCRDASDAILNIHKRRRIPFLVGGTPLYLNAILSGYTLPGGPSTPESRNKLREKTVTELDAILLGISEEIYNSVKDHNNKNRLIRAIEKAENRQTTVIPIASRLKTLIIGVFYPRHMVHSRIVERLEKRLKSGMIEEVEHLHKAGLSWEKLDYFGLEYRYIALYLQNKLNCQEMREKLLVKIRQFAKRQDVWFRKMERSGHTIYWVKRGDFMESSRLITDFLSGKELPEPAFQLKNIKY